MLQNVTANPIIAYDDRFAAAMARLGLDQCNGYLTAVSGGPDSTALALLTARYAAVAGKPHQAVIINHQLRAEAGAEARRVQARLLRYQISADIIPITAPRPASGLQEWARLNRHNILLSMARQRDAALLFGHHAGDQAETVAMRLLKGSGLAGLAGIPACRIQHDVSIGRPVLAWTPDQLVTICRLLDCDFETDSSNENTVFERVRIRRFLAEIDQQTAVSGAVSSRHLHRLGDAAARLAMAAETAADRRFARAVDLHEAGFASIAMTALLDLPQPVWRLAMRRLIMAVGGADYGPSSGALDRLYDRCKDGRSATIGGCHFSPVTSAKTDKSARPDKTSCRDKKPSEYRLFRETGRNPRAMPVIAGEEVVFAGCWLVQSERAGIVQAFADATAIFASSDRCSTGQALPLSWRSLPYRARQAIPVVTTLDGGLIYPQLKRVDRTQSSAVTSARFLGMARRPVFLASTLMG